MRWEVESAKGISPEHVTLARQYYESALVRDPGNIDALVGLARTDVISGTSHLTEDRIARLAAAEATLTKALSLAPDHASAHLHLGNVQIHTNRIMQGIAECERVLALDQNLTTAHSQMGLAKIFIGCAEETEAHINDALRLSPRDTFAYIWIATVGLAKLFLCRDEEAVVFLHRAIEINRNFPNAHFWLAAALVHHGRLDEARAVAEVGIALNPIFTLSRSRNAPWSNNPTYLAQRERIYEGMRKAGVPEG